MICGIRAVALSFSSCCIHSIADSSSKSSRSFSCRRQASVNGPGGPGSLTRTLLCLCKQNTHPDCPSSCRMAARKWQTLADICTRHGNVVQMHILRVLNSKNAIAYWRWNETTPHCNRCATCHLKHNQKRPSCPLSSRGHIPAIAKLGCLTLHMPDNV